VGMCRIRDAFRKAVGEEVGSMDVSGDHVGDPLGAGAFLPWHSVAEVREDVGVS
jgi:hypothetical protein